MSVLKSDLVFTARVGSAVLTYCTVIATEGSSVSGHGARAAYVTQILNNQSTFLPMFVPVVAVNAIVANLATSSGTVSLTSANVAAQAALVADVNISNSVASAFNAFVVGAS